MSKTSPDDTAEYAPQFVTRTGVRMALDKPVQTHQIDLDDITHALASMPTFDGHTVIPWSLACRALNFLNTARERSADKQLSRDELLSLALRDAYKCYRYDYAPLNVCVGETRATIAKAFGFAWVSSEAINDVIATTIQTETDQLLKTIPGGAPTPCFLPNYASHTVPANILKKTLREIITRTDDRHALPTEPTGPAALAEHVKKESGNNSGFPVDESPAAS